MPPAGLAAAGSAIARRVSVRALAASVLMLALELSGARVLFALTGSLTDRSPLVAPGSPAGALLAGLYDSRHWLPLDALFASTFGYQDGDAAAQRALSYSLVQSLLALLSALIPVVAAGVYWSSLHRTIQQRRSLAWIGTALSLTLGLPLLVALAGAAAFVAAVVSGPGSQPYGPQWVAVLIICLPGTLVLLAAVAAIIAVAGEACAALFGAHPSSGNATGQRRPSSLLAVVLLSVLQLALIYGLSASLMRGYSSQWEWFPLGALLLTVVVSLNHLLSAP